MRAWVWASIAALCLAGGSARGQASVPSTQPASAPAAAARGQLTLQLTTEEGKKEIQATLTAGGKPVEGATVAFLVRRTFGKLQIGKDQTLDDGTADVPFPSDLPGGQRGEIDVTAVVEAPGQYAQTSGEARFGGAAVVEPSEQEFPRALWAPRAPRLLLVTLAGIVACVWCVYAYAVAQLWAIWKGR